MVADIDFTNEEIRAQSNAGIDAMLQMDGALAAAIVDSESGMVAAQGGTGVDMEAAAAGYTDVMRAQLRTLRSLNMMDAIDDILITTSTQYHLIRTVKAYPDIFILLVLDRSKSNLAMARIKLRAADNANAI